MGRSRLPGVWLATAGLLAALGGIGDTGAEPSQLRRRGIQERPGAVPQTELPGRHKGRLR